MRHETVEINLNICPQVKIKSRDADDRDEGNIIARRCQSPFSRQRQINGLRRPNVPSYGIVFSPTFPIMVF
ncbi:hypothetical protein Hanom_Chr01g00079091 [Helianthus anomalus]